jgi:hypothetical protein
MMTAYVDGDVEAINVALLASEIIRGDYFALFETAETEFNRLAVLKYLLEQYIHMQSCWFVKVM